jgi:hypothetical protein
MKLPPGALIDYDRDGKWERTPRWMIWRPRWRRPFWNQVEYNMAGYWMADFQYASDVEMVASLLTE